mmetsp:Transcript_9756/g.14394  ORF Transcript_9756/g.14394 Transcript_9756/m.14394 type:complete len:178 (-) Transcript_9756:60-593(-)
MSSSCKQRLMRDLKKIKKDPPHGCRAVPQPNNLMIWDAILYGPEDTIWEGGAFQIKLEFTPEYPNKPPKVKFITKIFHPNVYDTGLICLDILQNQWSPIYDVTSILTSIQLLLTEPNPKSPANAEASRLYTENRKAYERRVKEICEATFLVSDDEDSDGDDEAFSDEDDDDDELLAA